MTVEHYTVFDVQTGKIKRAGACEMAQAHTLLEGEALYVGDALSAREWKFIAMHPVELSDDEKHEVRRYR